MTKRGILRLISFIMFVVAVVFVACALSAPNLGRVFYIGNVKIGVEVWRAFYKIYAFVMVALFIASFFIKNKDGQSKKRGRKGFDGDLEDE